MASKTGRMPEEDVRSILKTLTQAAENFVDEELSPDRALATKAYKAGPQGNEEEGRSQVVMSTVRDTILSVLPALLRTFFGVERAIEFETHDPKGVEQAEQESAYVMHLFESSPGAMLNVMASLMDGLTKRLGFVKWYPETVTESETVTQTGLTGEQLAMYEMSPDLSYSVLNEYTAEDGTKLYDCSVTRSTSRKVPRWGALPPEEVLYSRGARAFNDGAPQVVIHRQALTVGDCVEMGFDYDELCEHASADKPNMDNPEAIERAPNQQTTSEDSTSDKTSWWVMLYEAYARIDEDGDHLPELRRYYMVGEGYEVITPDDHEGPLLGEPVSEVPMACWCPYPEPHTVEGQSSYDLTKDLQRVDTALIRGNLDSLGLSLHGRTAYRQGVVNLHDLMNTEIGAVIRVDGDPNGALMQFSHAYVGKESFPLIEHMRRVREERTGYNMESQGLNADALQSSTKEGVTATLTAAQARTELIARLWLEQIAVPLFKGLRRLAKDHQDYAITKRIRGKFVTVDPRSWGSSSDTKVNIMLGGGLPERKMQSLLGIIAKQEFIIGTLGPANPIVDFAKYTRAVLKATELAGHPDAEAYFTRITDEQAQQLAKQAAEQPPKEDPATMLAKAQIELKKGDQELAQNKLALETAKFQFEMQLKQETLRQEFALKEKELELKYTAKLDEMQMQDFIKGREASLGDARAREQSMQDAALDLHKIETDAAVKSHKAEVDADAKVRAAAAKPAGGE